MKKFQKKMCILLATTIMLSCNNAVIAQTEVNTESKDIELPISEDKITDSDRKDVFSVRIPCDISFKITLLDGTDAGWVSSDDFTLENCGNNDVIVKFESVYYKFKDDGNFVSVDNEEDVRSITDKKAFFMKMICDGLVNKEEYIIRDTLSDTDEDIEFLLKSPNNINNESENGENIPENKGVFRFSGAANPLSDIKWEDRDVTVQINFSIYNADTKEFIEQKAIIAGTKEEDKIFLETEEISTELSTEDFNEIITENQTATSTEETTELTTQYEAVTTEIPPSGEEKENKTNISDVSYDNNSYNGYTGSSGGGSSTDKTVTPAAIEIETNTKSVEEIQESKTGSSGGSSSDSISTSSAVEIQTDTVLTETTISETSTETLIEIIISSETTTETTSQEQSQEITSQKTDAFVSDSAVNISDDMVSSAAIVSDVPTSDNDVQNSNILLNVNTDVILNESKNPKKKD
ncbi:MAG: hypothetical protein IJ583_13875 [Firmicutes bacterium]|nr:hypothetical protein [Bacillota bacterium]